MSYLGNQSSGGGVTVIKPEERFIDPVSKIRVSTPSNLIDTDFEYGLQQTKWETVETVNNVPTFFASTEFSIAIGAMTSTSGSNVIEVTCTADHNLDVGSPIVVYGSKQNFANGNFLVSKKVSSTVFQYRAKRSSTSTQSILDDFTEVYPAQAYAGTSYKLDQLEVLGTDNAVGNSLILVDTKYPHGFQVGNVFNLSNTVGSVKKFFDAAQVIPDEFTQINKTFVSATDVGTQYLREARVTAMFQGRETLFFEPTSGVVDVATDVFNITAHGLVDNIPYLYVATRETVITGLTHFTLYYVRVVNANQFYLTAAAGGTTKINMTALPTVSGNNPHALFRAYLVNTANATTDVINMATGQFSFTEGERVIHISNGTGIAGITETTSNDDGATITYHYCGGVDSVNRNMTLRASAGGAVRDVTSATINGLTCIVPVTLVPEGKSFYIPSHGFTTGDIALYTAGTTALPGLTTATNYKVEVYDANRFFLLDATGTRITAGATATTSAQGAGTQTFNIRKKLQYSNTFALTNHGLSNGQAWQYGTEGNTAVGGVTGNNTYYTYVVSASKFGLMTSATLGTQKTLTQNATNVVVGTGVFTLTAHGFTTGNAVLYISATPIDGLSSGYLYWVRNTAANTFTLHMTKDGAVNNTDPVRLFGTPAGTATLQEVPLIDLTSASTGSHSLFQQTTGAADGTYTVTSLPNTNHFAFQTAQTILALQYDFNPATTFDYNSGSFYLANHRLVTGAKITYNANGNTAMAGLTSGAQYYVYRVSRNFIKLSSTKDNAIAGITINVTSRGTGTNHSFENTNIGGEIVGGGTITVVAGSTIVNGTNTLFTSSFKNGDIFRIVNPDAFTNKSFTAIATGNPTVTAHGLSTGVAAILGGTTIPAGGTGSQIYYLRSVDANTLSLHPTPTDASANTNRVVLTNAGVGAYLSVITVGGVFESEIQNVSSSVQLILKNAPAVSITNGEYLIQSSVYIRSDGSSLHRPWDGGVEILPSTQPLASIIRQTRKYFRYQSGKGIQVSFAVNFAAPVDTDRITRSGTTATVYCRAPHRLVPDVDLRITNATVNSGTNYYNGTFVVNTIIDDYTFTYTMLGTPNDAVAGGFPRVNVLNWSGSSLRCGLFDDQNGLFFEYDGQNLSCVRRNSVQQCAGYVDAVFQSPKITGTNTLFTTQLAVGDRVVIRGMSYRIVNIASNTTMYVQPAYRGTTDSGMVLTKTVDTKVPQSQWTLDKCDGTGPTGYNIDLNTIQMAYMDYSWYGAGKVRFGFKGVNGEVFYVHEFLHNNVQTEAYLRSGNLPARYEIENAASSPSYCPSLSHWGTSVIMDGRFDDDKAYLFTASSNAITQTGAATITFQGRIRKTSYYYLYRKNGNQYQYTGNIGYAIRVANPSTALAQISSNKDISGAGLQANTKTRGPDFNSGASPYQPGLIVESDGTVESLVVINSAATATATTDTAYVVTGSGGTTVTTQFPLVSIRLAPSVDNGTPGYLGSREVINRMQLNLRSLGILTTHELEIQLILNARLDNNSWTRVTPPSLSQLVLHGSSDLVNGGTNLYTLRVQGGTQPSTTSARVQALTEIDLSEIATLGNAILGGNNPFPDGPDVLTIVAKLVADPSTVTSTVPLSVSCRVSWTESQA